MNRRSDRMLVWGFALTLFVMMTALLLMPAQRFSELENRYLQGIPELTWDSLISRAFADEVELYLSDQFPLRGQWIAVKSAMERLRLQRENNGIYFGQDGYLLEKFEQPDEEKLRRYVEALNKFAANQQDAAISFLLAPTSIGIYPDRLPWLASAFPQEKVNREIAELLTDRVSFLDGFDILAPHADEQLYYKTDHHWTTRGAYLAYAAYARQMGWMPLAEDAFEIITVSDSFLGSYHTKSLYSGAKPDSIEVYRPHDAVNTTMHVADTGERLETMYADQYLEKKDQYAYFLGGVHALVTLTSELDRGTADLERLLVVKDSYAHNLLPFLTLHVPEIHVIDIRYYNGSISAYMTQHGLDDVLLLFNTSTFVENQSILGLR